jgi:RluA family pseudouridine synthase
MICQTQQAHHPNPKQKPKTAKPLKRIAITPPQYFYFRGMRHVRPYSFIFETNAKQRWYGRELLEICCAEFVMFTADYYRQAIATGRITINGAIVTETYRLKNGDKLSHRVHRHEPPVLGDDITIIQSTDDYVVVNKPGSIPIHASGRCRHTTLQVILETKLQCAVHAVFRLDRLTSGLVIMGKNKQVLSRFGRLMMDRGWKKCYLARVLGEFPADKEIIIDAPLKAASQKKGIHEVNPDGRAAKTQFERVSYNGHTSVVKCRPHTGRTHQIRVHLQHAGFPIANDARYGGQMCKSNAYCSTDPGMSDDEKKATASYQHDAKMFDDGCPECQTGSYWTQKRWLCTHIWLHALSYNSPEFSCETAWPTWAQEEFDSRAALREPVEYSPYADLV